ncbi:MAG: hypothetical protein EOP05_04690 [Proteobacteria bacterium]|nr:MAG: hypothetical protein EOP05_04690 [Pseudomonadota bacterium]
MFAATPLNVVKVYETSQLAAFSYANPQIAAVELVPLNEQSAVSPTTPQGYLSFGALAEEQAASSSSHDAENDDDDDDLDESASY